MATVDFTLDDLQDGVREIVRQELTPIRAELYDGLLAVRSELKEGLSEVRSELKDGLSEVRSEIRSVKDMLTEDYLAEADRLTRTNKRLLKLRHEFDAHLKTGHASGSL